MARDLTIGDAARASGVKVTTIRFYEERGLLPAPPRSDGNLRLYAAAQVDRLRFIRHARDLGFPLPAIAELLTLAGRPDQSCRTVDEIARRHLAGVQRRLAQLALLEAELERMIGQCAGGVVADCRVIDCLGDHGRCLADHAAGVDMRRDLSPAGKDLPANA